MIIKNEDLLIRLNAWKIQAEASNQWYLVKVIEKWMLELIEIERAS